MCKPAETAGLPIWPVGQVVKTPPFHGGNTSSSLVRVTKRKAPALQVLFFWVPAAEGRLHPSVIEMLGASKLPHLRAKSRPAGGCAPKRRRGGSAPRFCLRQNARTAHERRPTVWGPMGSLFWFSYAKRTRRKSCPSCVLHPLIPQGGQISQQRQGGAGVQAPLGQGSGIGQGGAG